MTEQMMFLKDGSAEATLAVPDSSPRFDDDPNDFRIDAQARAIGRVGIAAARQALAEAIARAAAREQKLAA